MTLKKASDALKQNRPLLTLLAGIALVCAVIGPVYVSSRMQSQAGKPRTERTLTVNGKTLTVETVSSEADVERGLSGRPSMPDDHGMLFVFQQAKPYLFWMPEMRFSLDIVFIRNKTVVEIAHNLPAPKSGEEPATYQPSYAADRVLEINAGASERYGLTIGTVIPDLP